MRKETLLTVLGTIVFVSPLLGIPDSWRTILLFVLGVAIVLVAISYRVSVRRAQRDERETLHREFDPRGGIPETR
jgi:membrane protein implicated in regulation of membrane protease activity